MSEPKFKVGDVVTLRSGGPRMTVIQGPRSDWNLYTCDWWNYQREFFDQRAFSEDALELYVSK